MFIKLPETDKDTVALNLSAYDAVEIYEYANSFLLRLSKRIEAPIHEKATIQSYPTYDEAFDDFEKMMKALAAGKQVWSPQQ